VRRYSAARAIYYGHDLHFRRLGRDAPAMEAREREIWRHTDVALYLSEEEAGIASELEPFANIQAVQPYAFNRFARPRRVPAGQEILFVAGFGHPPNADAACWFVDTILPLIRSEMPDARLTIAGSHPSARVRGLTGNGVEVTGAVSESELAALYARARVAVVPLRIGAGVKLKVVEALAEGAPVVTTPIGAQGLPGLEQVACVEHDAPGFAAAVCILLVDDTLWEAHSAAGIEYASTRFRPAQLRESLLAAAGIAAPAALAKAA
jgi:glycosyltransferase involved in cell wall biosynthesis